MEIDEEVKDNTKVGIIKGLFSNDEEIREKLNVVSIGEFFKGLEEEVKDYYKGE